MPVMARASERSALSLRLPNDLALALLALWSLGAAIALALTLRQCAALLRLRRRFAREGEPAGAALQAQVRTLAAEMRIAAPTLRLLPNLPSPLVLPGAVLLPRWSEALDPVQQRAMLAHELAHLHRRDPLWRPLQRMALVPLFFHPLAWHAVRRLETLAETLCDQAAVERTGDGRALAECLAECLARGFEPRGAGWALAMAERPGGIVGRVHDLLETSTMKLSNIPKRRLWIAAFAVLLLLVALPAVMVATRPGLVTDALRPHALSITINQHGETYTMRSSAPAPGEILRVSIDGDVAFDDAERDVARMEPGAEFEIEQRRGGVTRHLRVTSGAKGLQREFEIDGAARPFDAAAAAWLASAIPEIYRISGLHADKRAKRILERGGAEALLAEIALLKSDFVRAGYLGQFFVLAEADAVQTGRALALMREIDSDYEKRRALEAAVSRPALSAEHQSGLLAIAAGMDSDFERAEWLIEAATRIPTDGANAVHWMRALRGFSSDFERKRALQALIEDGQPRPLAVAIALRAMRGMESDFERRQVLETAADTGIPLAHADYLAAIDAMSSDFERREALVALIRSDDPDLERSHAILRSVRTMSSDHERGEVLNALASAMPNDPALIDDYRAVARQMSDFERGQAEKALDRFYRG